MTDLDGSLQKRRGDELRDASAEAMTIPDQEQVSRYSNQEHPVELVFVSFDMPIHVVNIIAKLQ